MGGHIGAGAASHAVRNAFRHALLPALCVQPVQQAYARGGVSAISSSTTTQSASAVHASSNGGSARAFAGPAAAAVETGAETGAETSGSGDGGAAVLHAMKRNTQVLTPFTVFTHVD